MKRYIFIGIACALAAGCGTFYSQSPGTVFSGVSGFTLVDTVARQGSGDIREVMAGDLGLFVEFGADSSVTTLFSRDNREYLAQIVAFSTVKGALGAFALTELTNGYPVDIGDGGHRNDTTVQFVKSAFIVTVTPRGNGPVADAGELALHIAGAIRKTTFERRLFESLPTDNRVADSGLFFMGPKGFAKRYPSALGKALLIGGIKEGLSLKYRFNSSTADFMKLTYRETDTAHSALTDYLKYRKNRPVIMPRENLTFYTIIETDRTETYVADYADVVYLMTGGDAGGDAQQLFEYVLRGGK